MEHLIFNHALMTGGHGMVGSNIRNGIKPTSAEMDITNILSITNYIKKLPKTISCILHLAALNLRDSEINPKKAIDVNEVGTLNMLNICRKLEIPFIYISSGAVFSSFVSNSTVTFHEDSPTNPNCVYGKTKDAGEKIALTYDKTILIRTGWLFGGNAQKHYKFVETVFNRLIQNTSITCCNDFLGSTTYVGDLIQHIEYLFINNKYGIHHVVNSGSSSAYTVGLRIAKLLGKSSDLIIPTNFKNMANAGPIRSLSEVLVTNHKYNMLRSWEDSLDEYIHSLILKNSARDARDARDARNTCRLCQNSLIDFLKLEDSPLANHFVKEPIKQESIPLELCMCVKCNHIQLRQIIDPAKLYLDYSYVSSISPTMTNHLKESVIHFTQSLSLSKTDNILEIGANDGICIKTLIDRGFNVIGVDPAKNIHSRHNLPIICDFFGSNIKKRLEIERSKPFKLIYAFHCLAHIEDICDVFKTVYELLESNGIFVIEVGYFYEVFRKKCFDVIYHEHIDYHTCTALNAFARENNMVLFNVIENNIQGGSIQAFFSKNKDIFIDPIIQKNIQKEYDANLFHIPKLKSWTSQIHRVCSNINTLLHELVNKNKSIAGYGASAKSTTFLHQLKVSNSIIKYIVDDNIYKQGLFSPGLNIPIRAFDALETESVDYIIILSCNFVDEILKKLEEQRKSGLQVIIPFPEVRIV